MTREQEIETAICKRVYNYASGVRAASWPNLGALQAVLIAVRIIALIEELRELRMALGVTEGRVLH